MTTLSGFDERVLDEDERRVFRGFFDRKPGGSLPAMPLRAGRNGYLALAVWAVAVGLVFWAVVKADSTPEPNGNDDLLIALLLLVMFGGIVIVFMALGSDVRRWRGACVQRYLDGISYSDRVHRKDVKYKNGKAYRLVADGEDSDGWVDKRRRYHVTHTWTVYKRIEVPHSAVPKADADWDDQPGSPWYDKLPWDYRRGPTRWWESR